MPESDDERVQPALHAVVTGDVDGLRAALEADPETVDLMAQNQPEIPAGV